MIMVVIFAVNSQMAAHQRHDYRRHGLFLEHGDDRRHGSPFDSSVITMSILLIGEYALTMRNTLIDVLSEDYITTARAKGFGRNMSCEKHAMPNAMLPMVTIIAINLGLVIGGAVQIETIFSLAGNRQPDVRGSFRQRLSGAAGDFPSRYRLCRLSEPDHGFDLRQD